MSVFLERQKVRKRKVYTKWLGLAERLLLSFAIIFGGIAMLYGFYVLVFLGPIFSVREINVEGKITHSSLEDIIKQSGVKEGENLFGLDVGAVYKRLKENKWINHSAVRRRLPHTLWIFIEEYEPVAVVKIGNALEFVDRDGTVFKNVEAPDPKDLPVITGVDGNEKETAKRIGEAISVLSLYNESSFGETWGISEIHLDDMKGYSIITQTGPVEILLGQDASALRFDLLDRWQGVIGRRGGRITYIIANEDKRITVGYNET